MIDYRNAVALQPFRRRSGRRSGRLVLVLVVLGACFFWHIAGRSDRPAEPKKPAAPVEFTAAQINQMRANGRLLSQRGLVP